MNSIVRPLKAIFISALLSAICILTPSQVMARDCGGCIKSILCEIKEDLNAANACGNAIPITQKDIGTTGYVIDKPGNYCLAEDVVFSPADPANFVPVTFSGGGGSEAAGFAAVSDGIVRGIVITNGGTGYTSQPSVSFGGTGSGAVAGTVTLSGGMVADVAITNGGCGYRDTVQAAITIKASPVNLKLNNYVLSQAGAVDASTVPSYSAGVTVPSTQVPFVVGILIPDLSCSSDINAIALESIYISGDSAVINGFSMWGIYALAHTADLQFSNITISNCGLLASYYLRPFAGYVPNGDVTGDVNPGTVPFAVGGLNIGEASSYGLGPQFFTQRTNVTQYRVNEVSINNVTCFNNFQFGLNASNTTDLYIANSHFDGSFTDDPTVAPTGVVFGVADLNSSDPDILNLVMENSTVNGTSYNGDAQTVSAVLFGAYACGSFRTHNFVFRNCTFDDTVSTFVGEAFSALGFLNADVHNGIWENCSFSDVSGLGASVEGFHSSGNIPTADPTQVRSSQNLRLINCVANNIQYNGTSLYDLFFVPFPTAGGYIVEFVKNLYMENCVATDILSYGPATADSYAAGFVIGSGQNAMSGADEYEADNHLYRGCIAQRVITMQGGSAAGMYVNNGSFDPVAPEPPFGPWVIRTVAFEDCVAQGCTALVPTLTNFPVVQGAGIGFWSCLQPTYLGNALSGFPVTYTNCQALDNTGAAIVIDNGPISEGNQYSAGFFANSNQSGIPLQNHSYYECESMDNIYGFIFQNAMNIVVRNCRADLNLASDGVTGEGFTDVGLDISATPTSVGQTLSFFEGNHAYNNGLGTDFTGVNQNYNIFVDPAVTVTVATFNVRVSDPNAIDSYVYANPAKASPVHNVSSIPS